MQPYEPSHEERFVSELCHIAVLFPALGLALNIGLLLLFRPSRFVVEHLKQALGLQVLSLILSWTAGLYVLLAGMGFMLGHLPPSLFFRRAMLLGLVVLALSGVKLLLAVLGATRAFGGHTWRLPLIGDLLARLRW